MQRGGAALMGREKNKGIMWLPNLYNWKVDCKCTGCWQLHHQMAWALGMPAGLSKLDAEWLYQTLKVVGGEKEFDQL